MSRQPRAVSGGEKGAPVERRGGRDCSSIGRPQVRQRAV